MSNSEATKDDNAARVPAVGCETPCYAFNDISSAPKDGTKFIGLYANGLVFTTWWQAYNNYKKHDDGSHVVDGQRYQWTYDRGDALIPWSPPKGWLPLEA